MRHLILLALLLTSCNREVTPVLGSVHPYLQHYYIEFIELTGHVNKSEVILIEFSKLMPNGVLGIAMGMDADSVVLVKINANHWNELSENQKWWLVMHELAHDILNWQHGRNTLMDTPMPIYVSDLMIEIARQKLSE